jgi:hypothetical protein
VAVAGDAADAGDVADAADVAAAADSGVVADAGAAGAVVVAAAEAESAVDVVDAAVAGVRCIRRRQQTADCYHQSRLTSFDPAIRSIGIEGFQPTISQLCKL